MKEEYTPKEESGPSQRGVQCHTFLCVPALLGLQKFLRESFINLSRQYWVLYKLYLNTNPDIILL
jgi:hypothetical protein